MKPYEHQPYPSRRYHRSGTSQIVQSAAESDALLEDTDWADTPAAFPPSDEPAVCHACGQQLPAAATEDEGDAAGAAEADDVPQVKPQAKPKRAPKNKD